MKTTRRIIQFAFLALVVVGVFIYRGNAERWCPFGGVEALYTYFTEGNMLCSLGVSNFYILAAVLLITLIAKRAFCGYLCPIGTISEWLGAIGAKIGLRRKGVQAGVDRVLSLLKYGVLAVILYFTCQAAELIFRGFDPCYALLSRHGEDITFWAYVVAGAIVLGSFLVMMPFCRWLCPLAAVLNPFSRAALTRIHRNEEACISCGSCSTECPMDIPVDRVREVAHARCLSCLNCVAACPTSEAGAISWGPGIGRRKRWPQALLVVVLLGSVSAAVAAAYLVPIASFIKTRGEAPATTEAIELRVHDLTCRGRANLLVYFVERDDEFELPRYLKIEAWPGPGASRVRITFDPTQTDVAAIRDAIIEPYYDAVENIWRHSPFKIEE